MSNLKEVECEECHEKFGAYSNALTKVDIGDESREMCQACIQEFNDSFRD